MPSAENSIRVKAVFARTKDDYATSLLVMCGESFVSLRGVVIHSFQGNNDQTNRKDRFSSDSSLFACPTTALGGFPPFFFFTYFIPRNSLPCCGYLAHDVVSIKGQQS